ncbi:hydroxyethylthiazole kinase [Shigella flexneri]
MDTTYAAANAIPAAQTLARETGAIVVVTGEMDYVTDGHRTTDISRWRSVNDQSGRNWLCIIGGCAPAIRHQAIRWKMSHLPVTG